MTKRVPDHARQRAPMRDFSNVEGELISPDELDQYVSGTPTHKVKPRREQAVLDED